MRGWAAIAGIPAVLALLSLPLAGCGSVGPAQPLAAEPSPACGGFHLFIENAGTAAVDVRLNGKPSVTAGSGETVIYQYGPGGVDAMPWRVEIVDPSTGVVLATRDVDEHSGSGGARIDVAAPVGTAVAQVGPVESAKGC